MLELALKRHASASVLVDRTQLRVEEESGLAIFSLRALRGSETAIGDLLTSGGFTAPQTPNQFTGDAERSCAWVEPRAWLAFSRGPMQIGAKSGVLAVEVSDRFAALRIRGPQAKDLLAASLAIGTTSLRNGLCARTKFAEEAEVFVQQLSDAPDYRLLIDVSLGRFAADFLVDAAALIAAER